MPGEVVYIKMEMNSEVQKPDVFMKDIGSIQCADEHVAAKVKAIKVYKFRQEQPKRIAMSVLKIVEMIQQSCPGVVVENLGESDMLIEWVRTDRHKGAVQLWKTVFVALLSFFGTAFTIMAFHNDIGIQEVFAEVHRIVMGRESGGFTVLEISYSLGLAMGIILFFNHIGGRRITKDPTPIEVAMRTYEKDVNTTLLETADREGREEDVS